jgi:adenosylhomocysteine nucleosidase
MPRASDSAARPVIDVAVVCALEMEAVPLIKRLRKTRRIIASSFVLDHGMIGDRGIAVMRPSGVKRVAAASEALLDVHRPRWLISAGFAVGLSERVQRGDVMLASELVDGSSSRLAMEPPAIQLVQLPRVHAGRLLSVAKVPRLGRRKIELGEQTGAVAADVYSFALARACARRGVSFLALRIIVDDVAADAPPESLAVYHPSRSFRAGALAGAFLSGTGRAANVRRIRSTARQSAERLAEVLCQVLPRLP